MCLLFLSIYTNNITSNISTPPEAVEFIVTSPVDPETVILVPATIEVTIPVKLVPEPLKEVAVIIPAEALIPDALIVTPEPTTILVAVAAPNIGVTRVGLVANTAAPLPVSSVSAVANCADVKEPNDVVVLLDVIAPVRFGIFVVDDAVPVKLAVIVPALKLPEPSLATIADAVFALVAVVALLETLSAVAIVANLVSTIPADALISASTITPAAMDVTVLTDVISPVKLGILVVDDAVPVRAPINVVAVTTPVKFPSPTTDSFDVGVMVPTPTLSFIAS
jgi:hypothetical protein